MKLTEQHFDIFKQSCLKYQKGFGLTNYGLFFSFKYLADCEASCNYGDLCDYMATITLSSDPDNRFTKENIEEELDRLAFHEVSHILLARLDAVGRSRYVDDCEFAESIHEIINRLENFFKPR